jgi:tetratricopeptide (TPR) repeat protein
MLESLLKTSNIPSDLKRLVQSKAEGNPFYLEELVNSLIESETLIRYNGNWRIAKPISEADVSSSIHGLISGRLDRLDKETKRILQEASVIGRAFLYEILIKITELKDFIDGGLSTLERLDLIRTRALQPDLEYMFKHPLTQEVVYNGVLKKERQEIHEQIALVIEGVFQDRLPEFYETLAFHFRQGRSILKAVDYLIRSGEKSLARYAVEESHQYFKEAFDLLSHKPQRTKREDTLLIELLIKWSSVRYYMGDLGKYISLLSAHMELAESLGDRARLGMFYAWYGWSLFYIEKIKDSYEYLRKALEVGEQIEDQRVIGYACTWLSWTCTDFGALEEAVRYGERAQEISKHIPADHYLFFKSLAGIGMARICRGNTKKALEAGTSIIDYGRRHSNIRSISVGHFITGLSFLIAGALPSAIEACKKGIQTAQDPLYSQSSRYFLGVACVQNGHLKEAEEALQEVASYCRDSGCEAFGTPTHASLGLVSMAKGRMGQGLKMIEEALQAYRKNQRRLQYAYLELTLGQVYLQIVDKSATVSLSTMAKNVGFILKNVPSAVKKAAEHFNKAIEVAKEIGAKGLEGQAYLDLGRLHQAKGRIDQARDCFSGAVRILEECESEVILKQAYEALESLQ